MNRAEKEQCWYGSAERSATKKTARLCALKAVADCPKEVSGIENGYKSCRYLAATMSEKETEKLLSAPSAVRRFSTEFLRWCCDDTRECRGIEDWVSECHSRDRSVVARKARSVVVEMSTHLGGKISDAELVASHYRELSRSAVILARLLGDADRKAAMKPTYSSRKTLSTS